MPKREEGVAPRAAFALAVSGAQLFGAGVMIMCGVWLGKYRGGFEWDGSQKQFNYHPLFMVIGLVFLNAQALMTERIFRYESTVVVKTIRFLLQAAGFVFAVIALLAVFGYKDYSEKPNLRSIHSWVGIVLVVLYGLQLVVGIFLYTLLNVSESTRECLNPYYKFFGVSFFVGSISQCLMGITQECLLHVTNFPDLGVEAMLANFFGLVLIVFCFLVLAVVIPEQFHRPTEKERAIMMLERYDSD